VVEPVLLAIDSSTESLILAACANGRQQTWFGAGGAQASAILLPQAKVLLHALGVGWQDLDAVAFARGPGAFTGLRTACAAAQGLALGADCGVLPLDSLMIVAEAAHPIGRADLPDDAVVGVVMDARMGELYSGRYRRMPTEASAHWQSLEHPSLMTPDALCMRWADSPPDHIVGSGIGMLGAVWPPDRAALDVLALPDTARAPALLRLALSAWHAGELLAPEDALPLYVRDKVAQTVAERQSQAAVRGLGG
jgi:tRNA threonylcarbamoyladenosine biosynthesis protein TsaB